MFMAFNTTVTMFIVIITVTSSTTIMFIYSLWWLYIHTSIILLYWFLPCLIINMSFSITVKIAQV